MSVDGPAFVLATAYNAVASKCSGALRHDRNLVLVAVALEIDDDPVARHAKLVGTRRIRVERGKGPSVALCVEYRQPSVTVRIEATWGDRAEFAGGAAPAVLRIHREDCLHRWPGRCGLGTARLAPLTQPPGAAPGRSAEHRREYLAYEPRPAGSETGHRPQPAIMCREFQLLQRVDPEFGMDPAG